MGPTPISVGVVVGSRTKECMVHAWVLYQVRLANGVIKQAVEKVDVRAG